MTIHFFIEGRGFQDLTTGYGQDIYSNIDVVLLLCAMYHTILNAPACCREIERGPGILLLVRVLWKTLADSAELGCKEHTKEATYNERLLNLNFLIILSRWITSFLGAAQLSRNYFFTVFSEYRDVIRKNIYILRANLLDVQWTKPFPALKLANFKKVLLCFGFAI